MSTKRNARRDAATSKRAEIETSRAGRNLHSDYTTGKRSISRLLAEGQENSLHLKDLVKITGWSEREVRKQIHRERRQHIPILSNCRDGGYYLPGSPQERAYCVRSMRHRASEILAAARAIEEYPEIEGQVSLDRTEET